MNKDSALNVYGLLSLYRYFGLCNNAGRKGEINQLHESNALILECIPEPTTDFQPYLEYILANFNMLPITLEAKIREELAGISENQKNKVLTYLSDLFSEQPKQKISATELSESDWNNYQILHTSFATVVVDLTTLMPVSMLIKNKLSIDPASLTLSSRVFVNRSEYYAGPNLNPISIDTELQNIDWYKRSIDYGACAKGEFIQEENPECLISRSYPNLTIEQVKKVIKRIEKRIGNSHFSIKGFTTNHELKPPTMMFRLNETNSSKKFNKWEHQGVKSFVNQLRYSCFIINTEKYGNVLVELITPDENSTVSYKLKYFKI